MEVILCGPINCTFESTRTQFICPRKGNLQGMCSVPDFEDRGDPILSAYVCSEIASLVPRQCSGPIEITPSDGGTGVDLLGRDLLISVRKGELIELKVPVTKKP